MTYALAVLTLISLLLDVVGIREFIHYIRERDAREQTERRELLTRIQAPQMAPTILGAATDAANPESVAFDNDEDFAQKVILNQET